MSALSRTWITLWALGAVLAGDPALANPEAGSPAAELTQGISERIARVPEFQFIRDWAAARGIHAYLFGGTAASYAHHVKWDQAREKGDTRYQPVRFGYTYFDIYRSNQDLDIVLDGDETQAHELEQALATRFPYLQGRKSAWEVRLLRQASQGGRKEALLGNADFTGQNTDSASTGLIELTHPDAGAPRIRDLRDWDNPTPRFVTDAVEGRLTYYYNPGQHASTRRAQQGINPPIFSAIRYLAKAFQFGLTIPPEAHASLVEVVVQFDPRRNLNSDYVRSWIENNGRKLFQNALDIESAWNTLESLGLRQKLAATGSPAEAGTLAWWMSKEPLRSADVGAGDGKTAAEHGFSRVVHETSGQEAYESITRAPTGRPNALISRPGIQGERAVLGPGFYTSRDGQGLGSGWTRHTVNLDVRPDAREGSDFSVNGTAVIFRNRDALTVAPENGSPDLLEYYRAAAAEDPAHVSPRELAQRQQLRARLRSRLAVLTPEQVVAIRDEMMKEARGEGPGENIDFGPLLGWLEMPRELRAPHWSPELERELQTLVKDFEMNEDHDGARLIYARVFAEADQLDPEVARFFDERIKKGDAWPEELAAYARHMPGDWGLEWGFEKAIRDLEPDSEVTRLAVLGMIAQGKYVPKAVDLFLRYLPSLVRLRESAAWPTLTEAQRRPVQECLNRAADSTTWKDTRIWRPFGEAGFGKFYGHIDRVVANEWNSLEPWLALIRVHQGRPEQDETTMRQMMRIAHYADESLKLARRERAACVSKGLQRR